MNLKSLIPQTIQKLITKLRDRFPSELPRSNLEFETLFNSLVKTYNVPSGTSYRHAIATMVLHLGPTTSKMPKTYFVRSIHKAMSNEIAFNETEKYREEQKRIQKEQLDAAEQKRLLGEAEAARTAELLRSASDKAAHEADCTAAIASHAATTLIAAAPEPNSSVPA